MMPPPPSTQQTLLTSDVWAHIERVYAPEQVARVRAWERHLRTVLRRRAAQRARMSTQQRRRQQR